MFPALGAVLGLLHPVAEGVLRRGLKFQTCTNTLNNFLFTLPGILGSPHVFKYKTISIGDRIGRRLQAFFSKQQSLHDNY